MEMELTEEIADLGNIDTAIFQEILDMQPDRLSGELIDIKQTKPHRYFMTYKM